MAKKKRGNKKENTLKIVKKGLTSSKKINMVFRRFSFFLIFFVLFLVLNLATSDELWSNFFVLGEWIFGLIAVALLIVLLILYFLKIMKK